MSTPLPTPFAIDGELTVFTVHALKDRLLAAMAHDKVLEIDLSGVSEIDGAGIQLLLAAHREAGQRGMVFKLAAPSPVVAEALALGDLTPHFAQAVPSTQEVRA
jgi:anti-sigma B factor antagonist